MGRSWFERGQLGMLSLPARTCSNSHLVTVTLSPTHSGPITGTLLPLTSQAGF